VEIWLKIGYCKVESLEYKLGGRVFIDLVKDHNEFVIKEHGWK
jgi:hypothetical protein